MATQLKTKPGLNGANALSIPKDWDSTWFRNFINNTLKGGDVRNATGVGGIAVSGTIASPYATIGFGAPVTLPGPVTITAPTTAVTALTVKANGGNSDIDIWAGTPNGGALLQGYNSTGAIRTGYLDFVSGTGGIGGATETILNNDGATANDYLSLGSGGVRRVQINGSTGTVAIAQAARVGGSIQVTGAGTSGFAGSGSELLKSGTTAVLQSYNRTSSAAEPLLLWGSVTTIAYGPAQTTGLTVSTAGTGYGKIQTFGALVSYSGVTASTPSGTAVALQALPNVGGGAYLVMACIAAANDAANYSAVAVVSTNQLSAKITTIQSAGLLTITLSGLTVQATQSSGGANTITWSILWIGSGA